MLSKEKHIKISKKRSSFRDGAGGSYAVRDIDVKLQRFIAAKWVKTSNFYAKNVQICAET